ncbi:galactokinase [Treponema pedis]|uniref:Galactokinase n=1 Tax=Treponema pedis TaxID=409322 RepID=A0A7S6WPI7_9SPIR|nr:galactokinase [Treponema pedis]QOW60729.1 galactokinase [Treponema pedis]
MTDKNLSLKKLKEEFILQYGKSENEIIIAAAPARINIIGEHIDYNGGLVFPAAINLFLFIALRKRSDRKIIYKTKREKKLFEFFIDDNFKFESKNSFANYLNGMLKFLKEEGLNITCGFEVLISSDIPAGSGLSSSAALESGFGTAVCSIFNFKIDGITLAKIGKRVENDFLGLKSGMMDQFAITMGKENNAILLNTSSLEYKYIPLNIEPYKIAVMNSNKPRKLTESKYNERKAECEKALAYLQQNKQIKFLCELNFKDYKKAEPQLKNNCSDAIAKRVRHCVTESERVAKAVEALKQNDLKLCGKLLCESHISLKEDYEVTGKELDSLFFAAIKQEGCLGARMTGAGFSGCAIAIVHKDCFTQFAQSVGKIYKAETGLTASFFPCSIANGAAVL